jgi:splicing factor 3B subunit 1
LSSSNVRPYVHKILVVIEPLLIDEDYYARVEGREIISNLSKASGLAHMISTMRPDIDHANEYVFILYSSLSVAGPYNFPSIF